MAWWPGENLQSSGGNVIVGPWTPQGNAVECIGLFGTGLTTSSAANADTSYIGIPFEIQNSTRVERIWLRNNTTTGAAGNNTLTYQFGVYNEGTASGTTFTSNLMCSTGILSPTGTSPYNYNSSLGSSASVTVPTVLSPGVYFLTMQISNNGTAGALYTSGTTTVAQNRLLGVREAVYNASPNTGTTMPSSIVWKAPSAMTSTWNPVALVLVTGTTVV